jgi:hypothetical protein
MSALSDLLRLGAVSCNSEDRVLVTVLQREPPRQGIKGYYLLYPALYRNYYCTLYFSSIYKLQQYLHLDGAIAFSELFLRQKTSGTGTPLVSKTRHFTLPLPLLRNINNWGSGSTG